MSTPDGGFRAAPQLDLTAAMGAKWPTPCGGERPLQGSADRPSIG